MIDKTFAQKSVQVWNITYIRLCALKNKTGIPIVRLIDKGILLLEKEIENVRRERESEETK